MTRTVVFTVLAVWGVALGAGLRAHHSGSEYDRRTIEIEGRLVEVAWQNPHVHFLVRTTDPSGKPVTWDIEANSLSIMRRTDATPETLKVGDIIKVAGAPSRQNPTRMWAMNILAANGREIVLGPGIQPRWKTTAAGSKSTWFEGGTAADKSAGIFRVWSTKFGEPGGLVAARLSADRRPRSGRARRSIRSPRRWRPAAGPKACRRSWSSPIRWSSSGRATPSCCVSRNTTRCGPSTWRRRRRWTRCRKTLLGRSKGRWDGTDAGRHHHPDRLALPRSERRAAGPGGGHCRAVHADRPTARARATR